MEESQNKIKEFNDLRGWSKHDSIKDLLLNMNEEIGEFWNLIKWVDVEKQIELIKNNKTTCEDFIGDMLYLILKISYLCDVNSKKAINEVIKEYEQRFPINKVKDSHANLKAGGFDGKYEEIQTKAS
ncbi:MAG: hypothetical protein ACP5N7_05965 [Candidatus Pacearchaeota archaeon]